MKKGIDAAGVYVFSCLKDARIHAFQFDELAKRAEILRQAVASEANAGLEKGSSNAGIEADGVGDFLNVCTEPFTKVSEHIGIGNLDSQEGVGRLLDEFGAAHAG